MPLYTVTVPIAGYVCVEVEADDESSAMRAAFAVDIEGKFKGENVLDYEWEMYSRIAQGNFLYTRHNTIEVEKVD